MFSIDQVGPVQDDVTRTIMEERMRYAVVYKNVEEYISEFTQSDVIMLGGRIGVQLVLGRDRSTDTFMFHYELYSENSFKHANNLTNAIAQKLSPDGVWKEGEFIIWLKTYESESGKYGIYVDSRPIITIIGVPKGTVAIVKPEVVDSFDKKHKIAVIPAEILLLDIYRSLYTPGSIDLWEEYLSDENQLFHHLREREQAIKGGERLAAQKRKNIDNIIMQSFITNNPDVVLLGEHALFILNEEPIQTSIIQICTVMDIEILVKTIQDLPGVPKLTYSDKPLVIMKDIMLRRTTIKADETELLYVYNAAHYDLIPFITVHSKGKFIRIANPFVVMRFFLIEIWMVRWILAKGGIEEGFAKQRINSMLHKIIGLRKKMSEGSQSNRAITTISDSYFEHEETGLSIFQVDPSDYLGEYVSEIVAQKRISAEQRKYPDYMPQKYYADTGTLRTLNKK